MTPIPDRIKPLIQIVRDACTEFGGKPGQPSEAWGCMNHSLSVDLPFDSDQAYLFMDSNYPYRIFVKEGAVVLLGSHACARDVMAMALALEQRLRLVPFGHAVYMGQVQGKLYKICLK